MKNAARLFNAAGTMPTCRRTIEELEGALASLPGSWEGTAEGNGVITNYFAPMVYGREMFLEKGLTVVGKIHKHAHINVLLSGTVRVVTEFGSHMIIGPEVWVSEPGTKRAVHVLEDTRWLCIHPNLDDGTDLNKIEDYVIAPSYEALDQFLIEERIV